MPLSPLARTAGIAEPVVRGRGPGWGDGLAQAAGATPPSTRRERRARGETGGPPPHPGPPPPPEPWELEAPPAPASGGALPPSGSGPDGPLDDPPPEDAYTASPIFWMSAWSASCAVLRAASSFLAMASD